MHLDALRRTKIELVGLVLICQTNLIGFQCNQVDSRMDSNGVKLDFYCLDEPDLDGLGSDAKSWDDFLMD